LYSITFVKMGEYSNLANYNASVHVFFRAGMHHGQAIIRSGIYYTAIDRMQTQPGEHGRVKDCCHSHGSWNFSRHSVIILAGRASVLCRTQDPRRHYPGIAHRVHPLHVLITVCVGQIGMPASLQLQVCR
jgi:hypothetical protein